MLSGLHYFVVSELSIIIFFSQMLLLYFLSCLSDLLLSK
jgi:hypothetical protein